MTVEMPRQPFPVALDVAWHNYLSKIAQNDAALSALTTRLSAIDAETRKIGRTDLDAGFGRILIGKTRTEITDKSEVSYVGSSALSWEPSPDNGLGVFSSTLEQTTDNSVFRVTARVSIGQGGTGGTAQPKGFWVAFVDNVNTMTQPILHFYTASDGSFGYEASTGVASFWCGAGRLVVRAYRQTIGAAYLNAYNSSGNVFIGNSLASFIEIEEWAVI